MSRRKNSVVEKYEHEIASLVAKWDEEGRDLVPAFLTKALVDSHVGGLARANEHTPFFEHYTYNGARQHVGSYLSKKYGDDEAEPEQHVLPGFDHLQRYYIIRRGDEDVPVLFEQVTDEEFRAKAKMLRRRGSACFAHADEIERFVELRAKAA